MNVLGMQDAFTAAGEGKVKMAVIHDDISFILPSVDGDSFFIYWELLLLGWGNTEFKLLDIHVAFSWWVFLLLSSGMG